MNRRRAARLAALALLAGLFAGLAGAQEPPAEAPADDLVSLDFNDVELGDVIKTIAKMTGRNFIYDDRVRGRVTIVSPSPVPVEQAYAVFESVLQVKGFTTITTPGGAIKIVPVREAKESSVETVHSGAKPPDRDRYVTRLIPLHYIDSESIVNTLKPLVSKDAAMAAYPPTNTVILTESASNIRRLIAILESIDVETYKEELAVIRVEYADAATLADQVSEIYGAEVTSTTAAPGQIQRPGRRQRAAQAGQQPESVAVRAPVRIITDERTNSLLVLAPRAQLEEVRSLVAKLDVPVHGGGRIHVYYLRNADAEELAQTLSGLLTGQPSRPSGGGGSGLGGGPGGPPAPAISSVVAGLAGNITVTADPATNSLIIQASQEAFNTLATVIEKLDVERSQVLVEALIMEVTLSDGKDLGFNALFRTINGDTDFLVATATDAASTAATTAATGPAAPIVAPFIGRFLRNKLELDDDGYATGGSIISGVLRLAATDSDVNVISAPHVLTSDNEEAEIRVGENIPIITSRVQAPTTGGTAVASGLSTSVNVERQDIGVTLRVTPQITEGDSLRLDIFQEISAVNNEAPVGDVNQVGVTLRSRRVENTVVVKDGETVVVGGLIGDTYDDTVTKVPWLGDIPILGWAFKTEKRAVRKTNLLVFLTPHIVRDPLDLERESIRKREEFGLESGESFPITQEEREDEEQRYAEARAESRPYTAEDHGSPVRTRIAAVTAQYPLERMREIETQEEEKRAKQEADRQAALRAPEYYLQAAIFGDADAAAALLTELIDSGHDGTLVASESASGVLYEIRLGPYETLDEAKTADAVVRRSHGLSPQLLVVEPPAPGGAPEGPQ
ncbi:MAG TPA: type II secretion system secretin GspD [Myxococcota bacterium]|nr:type II secretion system secretin GspD [Myxococcota bacterium]